MSRISVQELKDILAKDHISRDELLLCCVAFWTYGTGMAHVDRMNVSEQMMRHSLRYPDCKGYFLLGSAFKDIADANYSSAKVNAERAISFFEAYSDLKGVSACYSVLGMISKGAGEFEVAQKQFRKVFENLSEHDTLHHFYKMSLYQMGELYRIMRDPAESENFLRRGMQISDPDEPLYGRFLNGLGLLLSENGKVDEAITLIENALENIKRSGNLRVLARNYNDLAGMYRKKRNSERAYMCLRMAMEIAEEFSLKDLAASSNYEMAELLLEEGRAEEALSFALASDKISGEMQQLLKMVNTKKLLSAIYEKQHRFPESLAQFKLFHEYSNKLQGQEVARNFERLKSETAIEKERQEKEIFQLRNVELAAVIKEKNDSLRYAFRIQQALMSNEKVIHRILSELRKSLR